MRARALLTVERVGDRSVVRELRSQSPLSLVPRRGTAATLDPAATVHLVGSAATPLGGDDVELAVHVGPAAELVLTGVAAAVALAGTSSLTVRVTLDEGATLQYLPEPTVVTARADHHTLLHTELHETARVRLREILVGGRAGEQPGRYRGTTRVATGLGSCPVLHQTQEFGDPALQASSAVLAGNRVLGTEVLLWGADGEAATGESWALTPLARRGSLATAVGPDAVSTQRALAQAVAAHPGWAESSSERTLRSLGMSENAVRSTTEEAP
ncbi:urease accessory protein UreD [Pseudonocardia sp. WMMC193]|uniref:urease accessory protein UreD n=1 Tax=Pseudonocardia sp. WMMC193 TaxID=2911965 RepID=UPI001F2F22BD|nr:urease accessory protein UreD [Pseudonocardia sp. WMMC193]MCF7552125.1 urease accessory protein UreD [Pseudonocardia sp. WMMC193]